MYFGDIVVVVSQVRFGSGWLKLVHIIYLFFEINKNDHEESC